MASWSQAQDDPEAIATAEADDDSLDLEEEVEVEVEVEVEEPEPTLEPGALPVVYAVPPAAELSAPDAPPVAEAETEDADDAPRSDAPPEEERPAAMNEPSEAPRLVLATTLGGLAGVVGGFGLSWGPSFAAAGTSEGADDARVGAYIMGVTTWGTPLTTAVGIFAAGRAAGGRGNFGVTLLGTTLGGILGAGFAGFAYATDHSQALTLTGVLSIPVFQWAGGVLAYHLSHRARNRPSTEPRRRRQQALPSVSVHRGGASLGWSGAF